MQAASELADVVQRGGELVDRGLEQGARLARRSADAPEVEQDGGDALLGAVMEVALDAPTLRIGDLDDPRPRRAQLALRPDPFGGVPQVARERRGPGERDPRDRQLDGELGAVAAQSGQLEPPVQHRGASRLEEPSESMAMRVSEPWRDDQLGHLPAEGVGRGMTEDELG